MSFSAPMAHFYDFLNDGADYASERELLLEHLPEGARRGLDLGCGTGSLALLLSHDFEMTGVDISSEMLAAADEKAFRARRSVRFICQDITRLSLGARFDFCLCLHDTLNYLLDTESLRDVFCAVEAHLADGGVFFFDISRPERYLREYAAEAEVLQREGLFCVWERAYHEKRRICDFAFHFFAECEDGRWERSVEYERQRVYSKSTVERLCREAGLEPVLLFTNETHFVFKAQKRG